MDISGGNNQLIIHNDDIIRKAVEEKDSDSLSPKLLNFHIDQVTTVVKALCSIGRFVKAIALSHFNKLSYNFRF